MRTITLLATDTKFPTRLRYPRGPVKLEAIGPLGDRLDVLQNPIAIVGTRTPSSAAWRYAYWLSAKLAEAGATIVSGGAYGIDSAAHEGALSVNGLTVAVLPGAIDRWQPAGNSALFRRITSGGGALVAFLDRHEKPRYHERNAAIAALADRVIVAAAPLRSGARNTADQARRLKREVWVVPGAPWDPAMSGCVLELALGGRVLTSPHELLREPDAPGPLDLYFRAPWEAVREDPNPRPGSAVVTERSSRASSSPCRHLATPPRTLELAATSPEERRVLEALQNGPRTVDELCLATSLPVTRLAGLLLTWTVDGVVREGPLGLYRLING
ncbi:MAG: DNA-processing protein DprA [Polyangiales bacterium]